MYLRVCVLWLFLMGGGAAAHSVIHLKNRPAGASAGEQVLAPANRLRQDRSHYLIQFTTPVGEALRSELAWRGAVVTAALPDRAVMVVAGDYFTTFGMDVEYSGRLLPLQKLSANLPDNATDALTVLVEFHSDVAPAEALAVLAMQGIPVLRADGLLAQHVLVSAPLQTLQALAEMDEVAYLFPASDELVAGLPVAGCAGALTQGGAVPQYALVGHGWTPDATGAVRLSYVFDLLTSKLPADGVKSEIERAFAEWSKYAPLQFAEAVEARSSQTIDIVFARGAHGDGYPFDGPGGSLAHTFYPAPPNLEYIAGDMHLDDDEPWHIGTSTDLFTVALHETGHALGLGHTDDPHAVMYPYYRFGAGLGPNDIAAIRALYGAAPVVPQVIPAIVVAPPFATPPVVVAPSPSEPPSPAPAPPSPALTVSIDNSAAVTTTAAAFSFSGRVWNAIGSVQVTWQTDRGATGTASGSSPWLITNVPLEIGPNVLTVTAMDAVHHSAAQSFSITRESLRGGADTVAPEISLTSPAATIVSTSDASITIQGVASDNVGVDSVQWAAPGGRAGKATGTASWSLVVPLYTGTNPVTITAYDAAGNNRSVALTVVRQ